MKVLVRFFAAYRDRTGQDTLELELSSRSTIDDLRRQLTQRFPSLPAPERLVVAVNQEYAPDPTAPLREGDEVALIPPVSGGGDD